MTANISNRNSSLGLVFPGQGSQSVGMLNDLGDTYEVVQQTFEQASEVLGYDLWVLIQSGPEAALNETTRTQPALLAAGVACWRVWKELGGADPARMAGHSLGEYTALVCADAMPFDQAIALVAERGRLMQEAVPSGVGAMAAILGLDDETIIGICTEMSAETSVSAANFNSPGQVVIAGHAEAVDAAVIEAKAQGAKRAVLLPVSVPSHCQLMKPAADAFADQLGKVEINTPRIPVIHNMDVESHDDAASIRLALAMQLYKPVRWVETIQAMAAAGITSIVECGPGKVLTGLNKRIDKSLALMSANEPATMAAAINSLT